MKILHQILFFSWCKLEILLPVAYKGKWPRPYKLYEAPTKYQTCSDLKPTVYEKIEKMYSSEGFYNTFLRDKNWSL